MNYDILKITEAEMDVMKVIWKAGKPVSARQIAALIPGRSMATVSTLLDRLDRKGVLEYFITDGRRFYVPYISAFIYKALLLKNILNDLFDGSYAAMVSVLLGDADLTEKELDAVKERVLMVGEMLCARDRTIEEDAEEICDAGGGNDTEAESTGSERASKGMPFFDAPTGHIERIFIDVKKSWLQKARISRRISGQTAFYRPRGDPEVVWGG